MPFVSKKTDDQNPLTQAIEDAILFGHVLEIDAVLDQIEGGEGIPEELVYGLQALRYFRAHYGRGGDGLPTEKMQRQQVIVMEAAWGAELLELLHHGESPAKRA